MRDGPADSGVDDGDVERAERLHGLRHHALAIVFAGHVGRDPDCLRSALAQLAGKPLETLAVAHVGQRDGGAFAREQARDDEAEVPGAAGDEGGFAGQLGIGDLLRSSREGRFGDRGGDGDRRHAGFPGSTERLAARDRAREGLELAAVVILAREVVHARLAGAGDAQLPGGFDGDRALSFQKPLAAVDADAVARIRQPAARREDTLCAALEADDRSRERLDRALRRGAVADRGDLGDARADQPRQQVHEVDAEAGEAAVARELRIDLPPARLDVGDGAEQALRIRWRADVALGDHAPHLDVRRVEAQVEADAEHEIALARGGDHRARIVGTKRHRLLDEHVLARRERRERLPGVQRVRGREVDGVDRGVGQHLVQIRVGRGSAVASGERASLGDVAAAYRDDARAGGALEGGRDALGDVAEPDERESDRHAELPTSGGRPSTSAVAAAAMRAALGRAADSSGGLNGSGRSGIVTRRACTGPQSSVATATTSAAYPPRGGPSSATTRWRVRATDSAIVRPSAAAGCAGR